MQVNHLERSVHSAKKLVLNNLVFYLYINIQECNGKPANILSSEMHTSYIDVMFGKNIANAGNYSWLIVGVEKNHLPCQFCLKVNFVDPDQPGSFLPRSVP